MYFRASETSSSSTVHLPQAAAAPNERACSHTVELSSSQGGQSPPDEEAAREDVAQVPKAVRVRHGGQLRSPRGVVQIIPRDEHARGKRVAVARTLCCRYPGTRVKGVKAGRF